MKSLRAGAALIAFFSATLCAAEKDKIACVSYEKSVPLWASALSAQNDAELAVAQLKCGTKVEVIAVAETRDSYGNLYAHVRTKDGSVDGYVWASRLRSLHSFRKSARPKTNWGQAIARGLQAAGEAMMPPEQAAVCHDCDAHGGVATTGSYDETSSVTTNTPLGNFPGTVTTRKYYAVCKDGTRFHN